MANQVIKKDGTKEPFDSGKITRAIESATKEAGISPERMNEVVNQVSGVVLEFAATKEEIATTELKEKILSELDKVEPTVAATWRKYDQERDRS